MKTNYKQKQDQSLTESQVQLLPRSIEAEQAVVGALMLESAAYQEIEGLIKPEDFYDKTNETIFAAIERLNSKRSPIDLITVMNELKLLGELENIGGGFALSQLVSNIFSASNIRNHALFIKEKSIARKLIKFSSEIHSKAFDESQDVSDILEFIEFSLTGLVSNSTQFQSVEMSEAVNIALNSIEKNAELYRLGINNAVPPHINALKHEFSGGWRSPDLIIIGARPSMGKTQHALAISLVAAMAGEDTLFISGEMTISQLIYRFILEDERINHHNIQTGNLSTLEWEAIDQRIAEIYNAHLHIADNHNIRYLNNIKSEARRLKRKGKLKLLIIDYLGLIRTNLTFHSRQLEIAYITGELKALAKELDIPIILLSQLNRPIKGTSVKEPQLEDLRESGDIEQDADIVMFIHKPDYYDPDVTDSKGVSWKNRGKLIIAKHRNGERNKTILFRHDSRYKKIWDYEAAL